ncbi:MAG: hypothetical protein ACKVKO_07075 [Acidimicrobiales bacterium]
MDADRLLGIVINLVRWSFGILFSLGILFAVLSIWFPDFVEHFIFLFDWFPGDGVHGR